MEKACVDTVESGKMTKDLAGCIYGIKRSVLQILLYKQLVSEITGIVVLIFITYHLSFKYHSI